MLGQKVSERGRRVGECTGIIAGGMTQDPWSDES